MKQNVSERIASLRKEAGLTQQQLADSLNVSSAAVSKWENGASTPDIDTLCAIADYFNLSMDDLLGRNLKRCRVVLFLHDGAGEKQAREILNERGGDVVGVVYNLSELEALLADDSTVRQIVMIGLTNISRDIIDRVAEIQVQYPYIYIMSMVTKKESDLGPMLERMLDISPLP